MARKKQTDEAVTTPGGNQPQKISFAPVATGNSSEQISDGLTWLNDRAWPLAGFIFFVPVIYLFNFIQTEKIPLSITSSSVMAAMPILFALILLCVALLVGLLLAPTIILFTPVESGSSKRLIDLLPIPQATSSSWSPFPLRIIIAWLLIPFAIVFIFILIFCLVDLLDGSRLLLQTLVVLSIPAVALMFVVFTMKTTLKASRLRSVNPGFIGYVLVGVTPQFLILSYILTVCLRLMNSSDHPLMILLLSFFGGILFICVIQLAGATVIASITEPRRSFSAAFSVGCVLVVLLGLYPPSASFITGGVFGATISGGRPCAVLMLNSGDGIAVNLVDASDSKKTIGLRLLMEVDGSLWVRQHQSQNKDVYFIDRTSVSGVRECQAAEPSEDSEQYFQSNRYLPSTEIDCYPASQLLWQ